MPPRALAALLTLASVAGCFSDDEPSGEREVAAPASAEPSAGAAGSATEGSSALDAEAPRSARRVPVSFSGAVATYATACVHAAATGACHTLLGQGSDHLPVQERGNLTRATLTLTWSAASPLSQEMIVILVGVKGDDEFHDVGAAMGPSPLVLEVANAVLDPTFEYAFYVGVPGRGANTPAAGAYVGGAREQPFTLEGEMDLAG